MSLALKNKSELGNYYPIQKTIFDMFPEPIGFHILSFLTIKELSISCLVCQSWKKLISNASVWKDAIYREIAFGKRMWTRYFAPIEETTLLPFDILNIIKDKNPFKHMKSIAQDFLLIFIPQKIGGKDLTYNNFEAALLQASNPENPFLSCVDEIRKEYGDEPLNYSGWVLVSKEIIEPSKRMTLPEQEKIVAGYKNYRIAKLLEIIICTTAYYARTGKLLFQETSTRCEELIKIKERLEKPLVGRCYYDSAKIKIRFDAHAFLNEIGVLVSREL